jgi:uncharacterized protein (UPF0218 family)
MFKQKTLLLPDSLRQRFTQPLGQLVAGSITDCNNAIKATIQNEAPPKVVLVGDTISRHAMEAGIHADLVIVDNKEMRRSSMPVSLGTRKKVGLINPQGTIAANSWDIISRALESEDCAVVVEGEEDLLVLVAVSVAPIRSLVIYGQPNAGIVLVRTSVEKKHEVAQVLAQMKQVTSA